jgi:hypothetical protein
MAISQQRLTGTSPGADVSGVGSYTIAQPLSGCLAPAGSVALDVRWVDGGASTASLKVQIGGVVYGEMLTSATTATFNYSNGASGTLTTLAGNPITFTNWAIKLPASATASPISLVFTPASGPADDIYVNNVVAGAKDSDCDGVANSLDLDSDGDGCPDAIEGGGPFTTANLSGSALAGAVSSASATYGIPVTAGVGQSIGYSQSTAVNGCIDADADGVADLDDLDLDNDGILNEVECPSTLVNNLGIGATNGTPSSYTLPAISNGGYQFDITRLDNGFQFTINGQNIATKELQFEYALGNANVAFQDGSYYGSGVGEIYLTTGSPMLRLIISPAGVVSLYGSKTTNGALLPMVLTRGTAFNVISLNQTGTNTLVINQSIKDNTYINGTVKGIQPGTCDTDGDGIANAFDLDSDGDGCPDAIEGGAVFTAANLTSTSALSGAVSTTLATYGLPIIAGTGQSTGYSQNSAINACIDADNDGIIDSIDLDDDNDGIVDAVEAPSCYYTASEANAIASISTGLTISTGTTALLNDGVVTTATPNFAFSASQALANATIFTVTYPTPVNLVSLNIVNATSLGTGATAKLQGSVNGTTWVDLSAAVAISTAANKVFTVNQNAGDYQYYRVLGVATATSLANPVFEITSVLNASYNQSAHPKATCTVDTDNDGITNNFDLDSDGDGCSDAFEGGATTNATPDYEFTSAVGTNGLANSLETVADNGTINYTLTYANATNASIKNCLDSDGDGVVDTTDIDDDNDGILDVVECPLLDAYTKNCVPLGSLNLITNGDFEQGNVGFTSTYIYSPSTGAYGGCGGYTITNNGWVNSTGSCSEGNHMDINADCVAPYTSFWCQTVNVTPNTTYEFSFMGINGRPPTQINVVVNGNVVINQVLTGAWARYRATINSGSNTTLDICLNDVLGITNGDDFGIDDIQLIQASSPSYILSACDTDGDGIPNHLDLDSDGDGCPDAKEVGVPGTLYPGTVVNTAGTTTNVANALAATTAAQVGANGYANVLETAADNGVPNFYGAYTNANNASANVCTMVPFNCGVGTVKLLTPNYATSATGTAVPAAQAIGSPTNTFATSARFTNSPTVVDLLTLGFEVTPTNGDTVTVWGDCSLNCVRPEGR